MLSLLIKIKGSSETT